MPFSHTTLSKTSHEQNMKRILSSPESMEFQLLNNMGFEGEGLIIVGKVRHLHLRKSIVIAMKPLRIDMEKLAQKPQNFQN